MIDRQTHTHIHTDRHTHTDRQTATDRQKVLHMRPPRNCTGALKNNVKQFSNFLSIYVRIIPMFTMHGLIKQLIMVIQQ